MWTDSVLKNCRICFPRQEILGITKEDPGIDVLDDSKCISFYAAECEEFPILGEVYTDLKLEDAFAKYDQIPENRMNGIKCIGFDLQDGSDWSGMFTLVSGDKIDKELINSIPGFRENRLVQEAVSRAEKILEKRKRDREHTPAEKKEEMERKRTEKTQEKGGEQPMRNIYFDQDEMTLMAIFSAKTKRETVTALKEALADLEHGDPTNRMKRWKQSCLP